MTAGNAVPWTENDLDLLQVQVGEWAQDTFPLSTPHSIATHAGREMTELRGALDAWMDATDPTDVAAIEDECADIALLLLHLSYRLGFSLHGAIVDKFEINQGREWQAAPDAEGVVERVRD